MAKQTINNGESGLNVRNKINENFTEVYGSISSIEAHVASTDITELTGNWDSVYTTVLGNSASWAIDNSTDTDVRALTATWEDTFTNVQSNSSSWNYQGSDLKSLSANWETAYEIGTAYSLVSATFLTSETDSQTLSFDEETKDLIISNGNTVSLSALVDLTVTDTEVRSLTANWEDAYTTVQSNSAINWNYQGTDLKDLSGNWQDVYTLVQTNSSNSWDNSVVYDYINLNFVPLSGGTLTGKLTAGYTINEAGINIGNGTVPLSPVVGDLWMQQYSLNWRSPVGTHAAAIANGINTFNKRQIISTSDTADALRITQTGTGNALLIEDSTNPDATPFVIDSLGSVGIGLTSLSGIDAKLTVVGDISADGTIYSIEGNSELWSSAYTTIQANSATTWNYQGTDLKDLSGNWQDTYTIVQTNSAAWSSNVGYSTIIGDSTTNPLTATHNLNTKDIVFSIREVATNKIVQAAGRVVDNNNLELTFNSIPTINQYDITVLSNGGVASGGSGGTTNAFALVNVTSTSYIQLDTYTHHLYNDTTAGGQITVTLLPPANHIAVTQHKKIGYTANIVLSAPNGATIDGYPTYTLMNQYEAIGLYSDGTNYFIQ